MAQSSGPQAFRCVRIQNRATIVSRFNGSGTKTAKAISFDVAAPILSGFWFSFFFFFFSLLLVS